MVNWGQITCVLSSVLFFSSLITRWCACHISNFHLCLRIVIYHLWWLNHLHVISPKAYTNHQSTFWIGSFNCPFVKWFVNNTLFQALLLQSNSDMLFYMFRVLEGLTVNGEGQLVRRFCARIHQTPLMVFSSLILSPQLVVRGRQETGGKAHDQQWRN